MNSAIFLKDNIDFRYYHFASQLRRSNMEISSSRILTYFILCNIIITVMVLNASCFPYLCESRQSDQYMLHAGVVVHTIVRMHSDYTNTKDSRFTLAILIRFTLFVDF